ncbi:MAG TPA: polyprenyl synthetase family protein [Gemmatimonadaceae bacterium]|nr:polyprenyl synthetase family protein [Gemmatimonadaceae bacterium]
MSGVATRVRTPATSALRDIQSPVRERLEDVVTEMRRIVTADLPMIEQVSAHLLQMRGKMFRPTLALLASDIDGTSEPRVVTLASVVELMHLASLVHDDSVDHSAMRRGLPTVNSLFSHQVSVIMGDFLYSRALEALVALGDLDLLRVLTSVSSQLTIGEMRQLAAVERLAFTESEYESLIEAKTASLLSAACETGAMCGAARHRAALKRFGARLGMAFQVADDILDYTETASVTGKPSGLDLREHKVTLPLIAALPKLSTSGRRTVDALFASEAPDDEQIHDVIALVTEAGGIDAARRRGEQYALEADAALRGLPDTPARAALADAILYVMDRRS